MNNIYIVGFMGSGKTSLSTVLSEISKIKLVSIDSLVEERLKMSVSEIFDKYGEAFFRVQEHIILYEISKSKGFIVDCGGGLPLDAANRHIIKASGKSVYLKASPAVIYRRLKNDNTRPLLKNRKSITEISLMLNERIELYESMADIVIDTDKITTYEIAEKLISYL